VIRVPFRSTTTHSHETVAACAGDEDSADKGEVCVAGSGDASSGGEAEWKQRGDVGGADVVGHAVPPVYPPKTPARRRQSVTSGDQESGPSSQVSGNF
jgi:hypothetical protein